MNKTAIKNFAIWARNKLIAEIVYKAGLLGITEKEIKPSLPQSTNDVQFFDISTKAPYSITGEEINQRIKLAEAIQRKMQQSDYMTAFKSVVEEVAYTWFNRLIAVRFMEVNDYLPSQIRVLSSESRTKMEPDLVTSPFDADLDYTPFEKDLIMQLKNDNQLDELFRMLFIKQCNALNAILPELFEKTNDYTELLMNVSFTDKDGVVYHLIHNIPEVDFNVKREGQIEIIGWMYQYYNTEPKYETFALLKKNVKITKERIPAATQLFTPDWIVRYMVENSLGRLWLEDHPNDVLKSEWKYYLDEAEQEADVQSQLSTLREEYKSIKPEDIKVIDPCMGSGHILVYAFDVLMQIYESNGYSQRDAAKNILGNNLYGLDIDNRAYQLAYFAVMMKARQYNRHILNGETTCQVYVIQESNGINRAQIKYFGYRLNDPERIAAMLQMKNLFDTFKDAKEYGSILNVDNLNLSLLIRFVESYNIHGQMTLDTIGLDDTQKRLRQLIEIASVMVKKYDVVVTNPPYMGSNGMSGTLSDFVKRNYSDSKSDLFAVFVERCGQMVKENCYQAMITQQAWMYLSSFEKLREKILLKDIVNMVHLGPRAFEEIGGEVVQTTSFVLRNSHLKAYQGTYNRLVDYGSQQEKETAFLAKQGLYTVKQENFSKIPGTPIAYWVSSNLIAVYEKGKALGSIAAPRKGNSTSNNNRFLRLWHEVDVNKENYECVEIVQEKTFNKRWFPYNKGGGYRKWYGNNEYMVDWHNDAAEIRSIKTAVIANYQYFMKPGLTWSTVSSKNFSIREFGNGYIFDNGGCCIFELGKQKNYILGLLNSIVFRYIFGQLNPTLNFQSGEVAKFPIVYRENKDIEQLTTTNVRISKYDWDSFETSWDFLKHPLMIYKTSGLLIDSFVNWQMFTEKQFAQLKANEEELNRIFIDIYGLQDELTLEVEDKAITIRKADLGRDVRSFISYAVGCILGRYSLDVDGLAYAGGEWDDCKYSTFMPDKDNIIPITDEEYFKDDIVGLFCVFLKTTFGEETLEENLDFIARALDNKGNGSREVIRKYFLKDFFKDHCKIYQKRPIYWLFDSGKADGFKALIYLHRYNADTIGNLRIDYLHRMQRVYESEIASMQETIENSGNAREVASATKRKEKLTKQLKETKEYDELIAHLALARISVNLDDGVSINYEKVQTGTDGKTLDVLAEI